MQDRDPRASGRRSALAGELQVQRSWGSIRTGIPEEQEGGPWLEWSRVEGFLEDLVGPSRAVWNGSNRG